MTALGKLTRRITKSSKKKLNWW